MAPEKADGREFRENKLNEFEEERYAGYHEMLSMHFTAEGLDESIRALSVNSVSLESRVQEMTSQANVLVEQVGQVRQLLHEKDHLLEDEQDVADDLDAELAKLCGKDRGLEDLLRVLTWQR